MGCCVNIWSDKNQSGRKNVLIYMHCPDIFLNLNSRCHIRQHIPERLNWIWTETEQETSFSSLVSSNYLFAFVNQSVKIISRRKFYVHEMLSCFDMGISWTHFNSSAFTAGWSARYVNWSNRASCHTIMWVKSFRARSCRDSQTKDNQYHMVCRLESRPAPRRHTHHMPLSGCLPPDSMSDTMSNRQRVQGNVLITTPSHK